MTGFDAQAYLRQLLALLPPGRAWSRSLHSTAAKVLLVMAEALARIDAAANALLDELDPRSAVQLLPDWEQELGLPDGCLSESVTLQERRDAVISKLTARGGQSIPFFEALGASIGYEVTITEFQPFTCGVSAAGDRCYDETFRHLWQVNAPIASARFFRAGQSTADEPLASASNEPLECVFNKMKPAHSVVQFQYEEVI